MTGENNSLKEIKLYSNNYVTFVDGAKRNIIGKGKLDYLGLPSINIVLLIKGLTTHLINIGQLCNQ